MQKVEDLLFSLFPSGTSFPQITGLPLLDEGLSVSYGSPPSWPPDAFAYAAKLLDLSGAYHHVSPETRGSVRSAIRQLKVSEADRSLAAAVGARWAASLRRKRNPVTIPSPPRDVVEIWARLRAAGGEPLYQELDLRSKPPGWWPDALLLLMISDEAAIDIGFDPHNRRLDEDPRTALEMFIDIFQFVSPSEIGRSVGADNFFSCSFANRNLLGVMPKSRTPVVGCTLRSLTHNLSLLPPGAEVRVRWISPHEANSPSNDQPLKILVIPYPYKVDAECFEPVDVASVDPSVTPWGWFHIASRWLGPKRDWLRRAGEFADFVVDLVAEAGRTGEPVGAVILPEAALNETFFGVLFDALLRRCPSVDLLVSGTSEMMMLDGKRRAGNFVAQAVYVTSKGKRHGIRSVREKHHRWRVEKSQIETYDLGARLNPATVWWEGIDITSRSLDIVAFRPHATMTTLICEDLARVDPCQGAVRAIGPTLLVALLMDGSQLSFRWPGRYATVLAEDPGCSVLTVSSLGLVNRTRLSDGSRPKWSVALWRDDTQGPVELVMSPGTHAVCFTVDPEWRTEATLDGRHDNAQALAWRLKSGGVDAPRSVRAGASAPAWIIDGTS